MRLFRLTNLTDSALILISLIVFGGGLVYRFYALNLKGIALSLALAFVLFVIIQYFYLISNKKTSHEPNSRLIERLAWQNIMLIACYLILLAACFLILFKSRTSAAIISPWQAAPKYFFIIYLLATAVLFLNAWFNKKIALFLIMLHYFLSFSIAVIIFQLGYGYDPFIHQATENLIAKTGAVDPRPLYYLGQYSLVVIAHRLTNLPLIWLDRLLVPALAAVFLPLISARVIKKWLNHGPADLLVVISLLILTFPFFIVTTPQNLANLFLLLAILLALICSSYFDFLLIVLLSLAAAITQPIAGIPALLLCGWLGFYHSARFKFKKIFYAGLGLISIFILPLLFYFINNYVYGQTSSSAEAMASTGLKPMMAGGQNFILNFIYFYGFNLELIFSLIALAGLALAWKYRQQCRVCFIYLALFLCLMASYYLTARQRFGFLINYEQSDYAQRILQIAAFFLLPFIIIAFYWLAEKILNKNNFIKISFLVFFSLLAGVSLYLSYPRFDNFFNSRSYSLSSSDFKAVSWINQDAASDYIVLADQQVSAAALNLYGFKKYYGPAGSALFYYPIPTSSPLYQYYLNMVYQQADKETMAKAMELAGVNQAYFVLNKYWWAFPKILAEAEYSASSWQSIDNGEDYVFKYSR